MEPELRAKFTARCDSVRRNNGIVATLFTRRGSKQDEVGLFNLLRSRGLPVVGKFYWIEVYPAFPTEPVVRNQRWRKRVVRPRRMASSPKTGRKP